MSEGIKSLFGHTDQGSQGKLDHLIPKYYAIYSNKTV